MRVKGGTSDEQPVRDCGQYHIERPDLAHCRTTRVMTRCWVQSDEEAMWCLPRRAQGSCFQQREGFGSKNTGFEHTLLISRGYDTVQTGNQLEYRERGRFYVAILRYGRANMGHREPKTRCERSRRQRAASKPPEGRTRTEPRVTTRCIDLTQLARRSVRARRGRARCAPMVEALVDDSQPCGIQPMHTARWCRSSDGAARWVP